MRTISLLKERGKEKPTIDPGEMMFCKETRQEEFDSMKVNAIEVNEDEKSLIKFWG